MDFYILLEGKTLSYNQRNMVNKLFQIWDSSRLVVQSINFYLNELVKRSTHYVFYDFTTKYTDIFVVK